MKSAATKTGVPMSYGQIVAALQARYPTAEYAFLTEVSNHSTYRTRTADALALSLWPSRGLLLHGFEIKVSRSDWLREKKNPAKAEVLNAFCDFWWIVFGHDQVAPLDEVPLPWGVLVPDGKAERLVHLRVPERKSDAAPWTRGFMCALLRKVSDAMVPVASVDHQVAEARKAGITEGERRVADVRELERLRAIETAVRAFEDASGLNFTRLPDYRGLCSKKIGDAIKTLTANDDTLQWRLREMDRIAATADHTAKIIREQAKSLRDAVQELHPAQKESEAS